MTYIVNAGLSYAKSWSSYIARLSASYRSARTQSSGIFAHDEDFILYLEDLQSSNSLS